MTLEEFLQTPWGPFLGFLPNDLLSLYSGVNVDAFFDPCQVQPPGSPDFFVLTVAGGGGVADGLASETGFNRPFGLDLTASKDVVIADTLNHRVRAFQPAPPAGAVTISGVPVKGDEVATIAGTGVAGAMGDGGSALSAQLNRPVIVAHDSDNNTYVDGSAQFRIRKIDAAGTITTLAGTGTEGFSGDGGPANQAKIGRALGLIVWNGPAGEKLLMMTQRRDQQY